MYELIELFVLFSIQLFLIVDPIALIPVFMFITSTNSPEERVKMARIATAVASLVMLIFLFFGTYIIEYFGISVPAIEIGGGILLFLIGIEMIYGKYSGTNITESEKATAKDMEDVSIAPLAIPLLSGPGAITTVILFSNRLSGAEGFLSLALGILLIGALSYVCLAKSDRVTRFVGRLGTKVIIRLMGLIVVFIAVQYFITGISAVFM